MREEPFMPKNKTNRTKERNALNNPSPGEPMATTPGERHEMISVAAYFQAERRGFHPGQELHDWWQAETDIDRMLAHMAAAGLTREDYERVGLRNALRLWVE